MMKSIVLNSILRQLSLFDDAGLILLREEINQELEKRRLPKDIILNENASMVKKRKEE